MKKLLAVLLAALMILTLCACGGELPMDPDSTAGDTAVVDTPAPGDSQTQIPDSGSDPEPPAPNTEPEPAPTDSDPLPTDSDPAPTGSASEPDPVPTDSEPAATDTDPEPTPTESEPEDGEPGGLTLRCGNVTAAAGEEVTVELMMENNPGVAVVHIYYRFDETALELIGVKNRVEGLTMTHGSATLWDGAGDYREDGPLAELTFRVLAGTPAGEYTVAVVPAEAINWDLEDVPFQGCSFTVTVE